MTVDEHLDGIGKIIDSLSEAEFAIEEELVKKTLADEDAKRLDAIMRELCTVTNHLDRLYWDVHNRIIESEEWDVIIPTA